MLVKTKDGQVEKFPYRPADFRAEYPKTMYSNSREALEPYGIYPVSVQSGFSYDTLTQRVVMDSTPTLTDKGWWQYGSIENLPLDVAERSIRNKRDRLLSETDWIVIKAYERNANIPAEWEMYRQALRDITAQEGFPHSVIWPNQPQ